MCTTQECPSRTTTTAATVTRRAALFGGALVAAGAALPTAPASAHGRRGLADLTYPLTTTFPAFAPGEEAARRTYVTIEDNGYYMQEWTGEGGHVL
ncbi:hypothetical protein O7635_27820 [Asanoa sp. WMMD1127]|uniref:hypothetical protein n=1 Tax=Asanoa sp. WMMD1127 TaxID=3016107 RepID=UPI002417EC0E|nr:hypothetical protein [Asanoa sp. WMMD1127]MDG4825671.1 hypothetical protein [Asanoa sp. WMMD1127]